MSGKPGPASYDVLSYTWGYPDETFEGNITTFAAGCSISEGNVCLVAPAPKEGIFSRHDDAERHLQGWKRDTWKRSPVPCGSSCCSCRNCLTPTSPLYRFSSQSDLEATKYHVDCRSDGNCIQSPTSPVFDGQPSNPREEGVAQKPSCYSGFIENRDESDKAAHDVEVALPLVNDEKQRDRALCFDRRMEHLRQGHAHRFIFKFLAMASSAGVLSRFDMQGFVGQNALPINHSFDSVSNEAEMPLSQLSTCWHILSSEFQNPSLTTILAASMIYSSVAGWQYYGLRHNKHIDLCIVCTMTFGLLTGLLLGLSIQAIIFRILTWCMMAAFAICTTLLS